MPLIDQQIELIDKRHASLTALNGQLNSALNLYHDLMKESFAMDQAAAAAAAAYSNMSIGMGVPNGGGMVGQMPQMAYGGGYPGMAPPTSGVMGIEQPPPYHPGMQMAQQQYGPPAYYGQQQQPMGNVVYQGQQAYPNVSGESTVNGVGQHLQHHQANLPHQQLPNGPYMNQQQQPQQMYQRYYNPQFPPPGVPRMAYRPPATSFQAKQQALTQLRQQALLRQQQQRMQGANLFPSYNPRF